MTFSLFDLLLIIIFSQGLFLLVAIQLMPNKNKEANQSLTYVLAIASLMLLGRVLIRHVNLEGFFRFGGVIDATIYLFGPYLYCYIRRLTFREEKIFKLNWRHYILSALYFSYFLWSLFVSEETFTDFRTSGKAYILYLFVELTGLISITIYIIKSLLLFRIFKKNQESILSYNQQVSRYLLLLLIALSCFVILWGFSFVNAYYLKVYFRFVNYNIMWISSSLLMYLIGFYSLTQPHIFRTSIQLNEKPENNKKRLKDNEIEGIQKLITFALEKNKVYLEPELSLSTLANKLNTTSNNLSWVLNKVYKKSFYEFVNEYRVKDFINRIKNDEHKQLTIFSIALEVGFNSKSTFNKSFKMVMNDTPSSYIKKLKTD